MPSQVKINTLFWGGDAEVLRVKLIHIKGAVVKHETWHALKFLLKLLPLITSSQAVFRSTSETLTCSPVVLVPKYYLCLMTLLTLRWVFGVKQLCLDTRAVNLRPIFVLKNIFFSLLPESCGFTGIPWDVAGLISVPKSAFRVGVSDRPVRNSIVFFRTVCSSPAEEGKEWTWPSFWVPNSAGGWGAPSSWACPGLPSSSWEYPSFPLPTTNLFSETKFQDWISEIWE